MFALSGRFSRNEGDLCLTARLVDGRTGARCGRMNTGAGPSRRGVPGGDGARHRGLPRFRAGCRGQAALGGAAGASSAELTPYGGILASYAFFFNRDPTALAPAISALQRVVAAEPECSLAWVQLSRLYTANNAFEIAPVETPFDEAVAYAQQGVRLDPSSQRPGPRSPPRSCQGRARGRPGRGAERARPQPGLPRLPRMDRLDHDDARRVGARPAWCDARSLVIPTSSPSLITRSGWPTSSVGRWKRPTRRPCSIRTRPSTAGPDAGLCLGHLESWPRRESRWPSCSPRSRLPEPRPHPDWAG